MSVHASADAEAEAESDADRLERYLRQRAADGEFYCKSKFIADDVDMSASQIGNLMPDLDETAEGLTVERWAYTNATTWRVALESGVEASADAGQASAD
ncbi:DUF7123 family protein [Haloglomus halophilum]|uniref:DUF7123 family protein n=1 Tax=Haloglomus halophilum TaxID=2962672 RepID=UPI0020C9E580|nr:hypothetical protein [Haloglomus halophilum]